MYSSLYIADIKYRGHWLDNLISLGNGNENIKSNNNKKKKTFEFYSNWRSLRLITSPKHSLANDTHQNFIGLKFD